MEQQLQAARLHASDMQEQVRAAAQRAQWGERSAAEAVRRFHDAEQRLRLQSEVRMSDIRLRSANEDLLRQGEMTSTLMEVQALSHAQQAIRRELRQAPPAPSPPRAGHVAANASAAYADPPGQARYAGHAGGSPASAGSDRVEPNGLALDMQARAGRNMIGSAQWEHTESNGLLRHAAEPHGQWNTSAFGNQGTGSPMAAALAQPPAGLPGSC